MKNVTFVMLKPDAVERRLCYRIVTYFRKEGISVDAIDVVTASEDHIRRHYAEHFAKYGEVFAQKMLREFLGKTVVPIVLSGGEDIIADVRRVVGATEPAKAAPGTIRGDLGGDDSYEKSASENRVIYNLIHASDSPEAVKREIGIWLPDYPVD